MIAVIHPVQFCFPADTRGPAAPVVVVPAPKLEVGFISAYVDELQTAVISIGCNHVNINETKSKA